MKKTSLLFVLVILFSVVSTAQIENIDLNKYKLNDYRYSSLGTNLSLNGFYSKDKNTNDFFNSEYSTKNKSLNSNLNLNYTLNISNRKYIGYHSINGSYSHSFSSYSNKNSTSPESKLENILTNYLLGISSSNAFYLNEKLFWGLNFQSITTQQNLTNKRIPNSDPQNTEKNIILNSNNRLSVQIGYGRVENVTDARQAIYILDDLNKKNRLTHEPTPEEAFEFADFIRTVLNKRIIDSREKRIYEYTLIDSFLVSKGLISKQDGKYFSILNDNWSYARTQSWYTGSKVYFGIISELNDRHEFNKTTYPDNPDWNEKSTEEVMNKSIGIETGFEVSWIKGLKWINSFDCNLSLLIDHYDPYYSDYTNPERNQKLNLLESDIYYSLSFVPNTRSIVTGSAGAFYACYKDVDNEKASFLSPFARISCTYYFSQKLQVNAFTQLSYNKATSEFEGKDDTSKSTRINFGINLNYYFF